MTLRTPPLVIPEAPSGAIGDAPPLTAARMLEQCWSHIQAAVAAGRVIEARGWMRLYKDLKPFARYEEIAAREARLEREAAERRAAEAVANEEAEETAPADEQDVALSLHCFSHSESHAPRHADDDPAEAPALDGGPDALPVKELARLMADLQALTTRAGTVLCDEAMRLPLHCFSRPESHHPGQGP